MLALKSQKTHDLAIRLRNDDIEAFNSLYWKYHDAIYRNALKLIKDPRMAEDIVQDVFIALWEKRHAINPKENIGGWLFVVSYHKSIDQLKRKLRQTLAEKVLHDIVENPVLLEVDVKKEQIGIMEKAVDQLSPQKKKVFELCKIQRTTYERVAKELRISKYSVKEYLSDAIVSIRKYIGEHSTHSNLLICFILLSEIFSA